MLSQVEQQAKSIGDGDVDVKEGEKKAVKADHSIRDSVGLGGRLLALIKSEWKTGVFTGLALYTGYLALRNLRLEKISEVATRGYLGLLDVYESRLLEDNSRDRDDLIRTIRRIKDVMAGELRFVMNPFRVF